MRAPRGLKLQRGYFWGLIAAAASAAASAGGSAYSANVSRASAKDQMRFQEGARATQYSTAMEDMRRAGLNPMLAYSQGGAGNLTGAGYSADMGGVASSAMQSARILQELKLLDAQTEKTKSDVDVNREVMKEIGARVANTNVSTALAQSDLPRAKNMAEVEDSKFGKAMRWVDRFMQAFGLGSKTPKGVGPR